MRQGPAQRTLRLVHADVVGGVHVLSERNIGPRSSALAAVARENQRAATLSALDARWILAVQVSQDINMSGAARAGVLAPERRRKIIGLATRLGLRAFDANLVIAIVQDGCRSGEGALSREVSDRLAMVRPPEPPRGANWRELAAWLVAGGCLALTVGLALTRWITG